MDIIALSKANKAKKAIQSVRDRLGVDGTESGLDITDIYDNAKERLQVLEEKDPGVDLFNRVGKLEAQTTINLNKHNLRMGALLNQKRYRLTDMVIDDFNDDSGIDKELSKNYLYDADKGIITVKSGEEIAEVVTIAEEFKEMSMFFISSAFHYDAFREIEVDLSKGIFDSTMLQNGIVTLTKDEHGSQEIEGSYETEVIFLSHAVEKINEVRASMIQPEEGVIQMLTSSSSDGITFSDYTEAPIQKASYVRFKFTFKAAVKEVQKALDIRIKEGNGIYKGGSFQLNDEEDNTILIRHIQQYEGFQYDPSRITWSIPRAYGPSLCMTRTIEKGWNR